MSIESRLKKLETKATDEAWGCRPLTIIGRVEAYVRVANGAFAKDPRVPDPPDVTVKISEAVRACLEVMETQGNAAGKLWSENLKAELLPGHTGIILRDLEAETERAAFKRGDLTGERKYPESPAWASGGAA